MCRRSTWFHSQADTPVIVDFYAEYAALPLLPSRFFGMHKKEMNMAWPL
jgi:hypothetical protein